ncbi:unnamed protein product [Cuscuta epithymum]|uniref:RNase H type-1 domain-containing protein n=1 Tax=Cuscuta epithymum TaxID=186058 RepID=A0AAV0C4Y5_9ASTE|nr:unnamed protein product [Cuscuta epithymum]
MAKGFAGFQVETDAICVLDLLHSNVLGNFSGLQTFRRRVKDKGVFFCHVLREGNVPTHNLATQRIDSACSILFDGSKICPTMLNLVIMLICTVFHIFDINF